MNVIAKAGNDEIAMVYIMELDRGKLIECVESVQPPVPREKKWVLMVSTLYGCPVGCRFCDAGEYYRGKLSKDDILTQIDYLIDRRFPDRKIPSDKFKIQFARMGEPAYNMNVLDVLEEIPGRYDAPGLLPSLSSTAPNGSDTFFEKLREIKERLYKEKFQLQFSIHTTDRTLRDWLIPVKKWKMEKIGEYGESFFRKGERKVTLNFALAEGMPVDPSVLVRYFSPDTFLIKITPVNPTYRAVQNEITSHILPGKEKYTIIETLKSEGYEVILSIGETAENYIGSNCGQYISTLVKEKETIQDGYTYSPEPV